MSEEKADAIVKAIDTIAIYRALQTISYFEGKSNTGGRYSDKAMKVGELLKRTLMYEGTEGRVDDEQ